MAKENLRELSTEDLIKKRKTTAMTTGMLAGILTVLLIMAIFLTIKQENKAVGISLMVVPFGLSGILFTSYNFIKKIDEELKSRNSN